MGGSRLKIRALGDSVWVRPYTDEFQTGTFGRASSPRSTEQEQAGPLQAIRSVNSSILLLLRVRWQG